MKNYIFALSLVFLILKSSLDNPKNQKDLAVSTYNSLKKLRPPHSRCPQIQDFLRAYPTSARYIAKEIEPEIDKLDSCTIQALVESDKTLEKILKEKSHNPEKITQKIHYLMSDPKIDVRVQKTIEKFYFKTQSKPMTQEMQKFTLQAFSKDKHAYAGEVSYIISHVNIALIESLHVQPEFYRQGIGSTLFLKTLSHTKSSYPEEKSAHVSFQVKPFCQNLSFSQLAAFYSSLGARFWDQETEWGKKNMLVTLKKDE